MNAAFADPTQMLRRHLIARGHDHLEQGRKNRPACTQVRKTFAGYYGDLPAVLAANPLQARQVGAGTGAGFRYENWLFESHPGWEVNATLYLPADLPPPYPPIVVPVGHSGKQFAAYQRPCQYFARAGLAALVFDPPGVAGEKQRGNDHFCDGVRCHLTGDTSSRYFVGDALRAMDFLGTRADIDRSHGFTLTGVSGGGNTSVFAALLDERATLIAPSCCLTRQGRLVLDLCYSSCPETLMPGRLRDGLDDSDLLRALAPRPVLLMAGETDEVFPLADTAAIAQDAAAHYAATGAADKFEFFTDTGGHDYSLRQARRLVEFIRHHWQLDSTRPLPAADDDAFPLLEPAAIACRPRPAANMLTLTRARAAACAGTRRPPTPALIRTLIGLAETGGTFAPAARHAPLRTWFHDWREFLLETEPGITVPVTLADPGPEQPLLWHFDDNGRLRRAHSGGPLTRMIGHPERNSPKAALLAADLRGWGETAMTPHPYESVSWGAPDRFAAYVGAALGDSPVAMRIRDAWRLARAFPLRARNVLSACGAAGPVALHLAALWPGRFAAVVLRDAPASYEALLATDDFAWPHDIILPGVLQHYDLPQLALAADCPVHWLNPLDGARRPVALDAPHVLTNTGDNEHIALVRQLLYG
jgi:dienelactone hydrolase